MKKPSLLLWMLTCFALYAALMAVAALATTPTRDFVIAWMAFSMVVWPLLVAMMAFTLFFWAAKANGPMPASSQTDDSSACDSGPVLGVNSRGNPTMNGINMDGSLDP